jgi:hypothetical protein
MRENRFTAARNQLHCHGRQHKAGHLASNPRNSMTMPNERCCKIDVSQPTVK